MSDDDLRKQLEEAEAKAAAMRELALRFLHHAGSAIEDLPRGTTIRDDYQERHTELSKEFDATDVGWPLLDRLHRAEERATKGAAILSSIDDWLDAWMKKNEYDFPSLQENPVLQRVQILAHICHSAIGSRGMAQRICLEQQGKADKAERERDNSQVCAEKLEAEVARLAGAGPSCDCGDRMTWNAAKNAFYCIGCDKTVKRPEYATKAEVTALAQVVLMLIGFTHMGNIPDKALHIVRGLGGEEASDAEKA